MQPAIKAATTRLRNFAEPVDRIANIAYFTVLLDEIERWAGQNDVIFITHDRASKPPTYAIPREDLRWSQLAVPALCRARLVYINPTIDDVDLEYAVETQMHDGSPHRLLMSILDALETCGVYPIAIAPA